MKGFIFTACLIMNSALAGNCNRRWLKHIWFAMQSGNSPKLSSRLEKVKTLEGKTPEMG